MALEAKRLVSSVRHGSAFRALARSSGIQSSSIWVRYGAGPAVFLASSSDVEGVSGGYFNRKGELKSSRLSYDEDVAHRLWDVSARLSHLNPAAARRS